MTITKLRQFFVLAVMAGVLCLGLGQTALASTYGSGDYGVCAYQTDCPANSGAPNTGLQHTSLLWPLIAGVFGFSIMSFVLIRYLNRGRHTG